MPVIFHHQANFTSGELSDTLTARIGFAGYEKGAAKLRNVLVIPQGGLKRRFGTKKIFDIDQLNIPNFKKDEFKFRVLEFNLSPRYLMAFTPTRITVFLIDENNVTTEIFNLLSPYLASEIKDLKFTQDSSVLIVMHENHKTALLRRIKLTPATGGNPDGWNADTNTPTLVSGIGTIDEAYFVNTPGTTTLDGNTDWLVGEWAVFRVITPPTSGLWVKLQPVPPNEPWELVDAAFKFLPTFDFKGGYDATNFLPINLSDVTMGGIQDGGVTIINPLFNEGYRFSPDLVGGIFTGNGGTMRIDRLDGAAVPGHGVVPNNERIRGKVIQPFTGDGQLTPKVITISGKTVLITEPAFSDDPTRGWPKSGTFYQDRLWFGGSKALPQGIFASQINDFFDFDDTAGIATDAIFDFIGSTKANVVRFVVGAKSLVVFTTDGEFSTQLILEDGITPQNISLIQQSQEGSADVEPVVMDNQIIFVDRGSQIIRNMIYDSQSGSYVTENISFLSSELIDNPVSSALFKGQTADDSVYLFLVNEGTEGTETEGSIAAFQTLQSQDIAAWSLLTTQGKFLQTTSASDIAFFFVEREGKFLIEQLDFDLLLDTATVIKFLTPNNLIEGLGYLNNQLVRVIADGVILNGPQDGLFVVQGNSLLLPDPVTDVIVGLDFTPLIETLPININTQTGPTLYLPKTIIRVFVDFVESLGIEVNGTSLPNLTFSGNDFTTPPDPKTGFDELKINTAFTKERQTIRITQSLPFPMTIIAIGTQVKI